MPTRQRLKQFRRTKYKKMPCNSGSMNQLTQPQQQMANNTQQMQHMQQPHMQQQGMGPGPMPQQHHQQQPGPMQQGMQQLQQPMMGQTGQTMMQQQRPNGAPANQVRTTSLLSAKLRSSRPNRCYLRVFLPVYVPVG